MPDLLDATAALIDIPSVSHDEAAITAHVAGRLRRVGWLEVDVVGHNVVARSQLGRAQRLLLGGHTDTVPANGNARPRREGSRLFGLGAADMKSGLAVMLDLAETLRPDQLGVDLTFVFYECEEVEAIHNGLRKLFDARPELLAGDAAILGEPTNGELEAGCQGTMRLQLVLGGARAHTARPWTGRNAVHRLAPVLDRLARYQERRPVLDGCEFREALQAVRIEGGVAGNVVPDRVALTLNHRFAPDRSSADALAHVRSVIGAELLADDAELVVLDEAAPAPPGLAHPLLQALSAQVGTPPKAKLGWTDVSFFAGRGVPAVNFGPGDPLLAHTAHESVGLAETQRVSAVLRSLICSRHVRV